VIYGIVLLAHSWLRWVVLALGIVLFGVALWAAGRSHDAWSDGSERLRRRFLGALDAQMLLGIVLYAILSPFSRAGLSDIAGAMANPILRFYTVEHVFGMIVAIAVAHAGSARAMRVEGARRHRVLLVTQALWLLITLASIRGRACRMAGPCAGRPDTAPTGNACTVEPWPPPWARRRLPAPAPLDYLLRHRAPAPGRRRACKRP